MAIVYHPVSQSDASESGARKNNTLRVDGPVL